MGSKFSNNINAKKKIAIMGASFSTGNLGVSALAWSTVYLLKSKWPHSEIFFIGGRDEKVDIIEVSQEKIEIKNYPVRYCKNLLVSNHIMKILLKVLFTKIVRKVARKSPSTADVVISADFICDITGGDSFSDIYGKVRFLQGFLIKKACQWSGKPFVLLPQTYGPYYSVIAKRMARNIIKKSTLVYTRDEESKKSIRNLVGVKENVIMLPDVAFCLEPTEINRIMQHKKGLIKFIDNILEKKRIKKIIGLNISGLLYNGGYTGDNQFGLKTDYREMVHQLIEHFISKENIHIIIFPHVSSHYIGLEDGDGSNNESDLIASLAVYNDLDSKHRDSVNILDAYVDQCEIKGIIGLCDFFIGSRMHATIASMSQCIPSVGLAYSKKFIGVYDLVGMNESVVDLRKENCALVIAKVYDLYNKMDQNKLLLQKNVPLVIEKVKTIFDRI